MLLLSTSTRFLAPSTPKSTPRPVVMEDKQRLWGRAAPVVPDSFESIPNLHPEAQALAYQLNPAIGYWDPLGLASADFWQEGNDATWGWLRHAEIKHGRIAMAAFVGFIVQSNGYHWPFPLTGGGVEQLPYAAGLTPPEQWNALTGPARIQIILFIGFLEWWSEFAAPKHYMRGGKPGYFPPFNPEKYKGAEGETIGDSPNPFPLPSLYDPWGQFYKKGGAMPIPGSQPMLSEEAIQRGRLVEINNGRLAMIGIFGFLAEEKIPGAVPALAGLVKPFSGNVMGPFVGMYE